MTKPRPIRTATEHAIEVPRTARYYVLGADGAQGRDLWIVLHGFGQLAGDFVEYFATLNDGHHIVVAPEALNRYYTMPVSVPTADRGVGATWMTKEHRDAEISDYVRYLDRLYAELQATYRPRRTIALGFSQGAATAARWAVMGTTKLDALILWGATLTPDVDPATVNRHLGGAPLHLVIGRTDQYISPEAVARERERLDAAGARYQLTEFDGGHSIKRGVLSDVARLIAETT